MTLRYFKPTVAGLTAAAAFARLSSILRAKSFVLIGLCAFATVSHLHADVIVSVTGTSLGGGVPLGNVISDVVVSSWSSTNAYSDVTVSAELGTFDPTTTGTAYLMNMIGPGTTTANQIATANYTVSSPNSTLIPLFTGLDLLPGSYHLVLTGPTAGNAFWRQTFNDATVTTAPGVDLTDFGFAYIGAAETMVNFGYAPASVFALTPDLDVRFSVMGAPVPEPASWLLFGTVLAFVAIGKCRVRPILAARALRKSLSTS